MSFLYPGFLFAFFALSIPVIIHLFNFRRFRTIYFTNVRFLKDIREETAARNRLKHWLILAARLLALSFLILAFARPYLPSQNESTVEVKHSVSIYIDNSFSMESMHNDMQLLDLAKQKAEEIVNAYAEDDRFQLVTNDLDAWQQQWMGKEAMLDRIREVQTSPDVRPLNMIFGRQKDLFTRTGDANSIAYLLSDFQKSTMNLENDTDYQIRLLPLSGTATRNLALDSAWFISPVQMTGQASMLCVLIKNFGDKDVDHTGITLKLNGQIKAVADIPVAAGSEATDTLSFTLHSGDWQNGEISVEDYPVSFDDNLYFAMKPVDKVPVLSINAANSNAFIQSLYGSSPLFLLQNEPLNNISFSSLGQYDLIILNDLTSISSGLAEALDEQLAQGARILVFPSFDMDIASVNTFLARHQCGEYGEVLSVPRSVVDVDTKQELFSGVFEKVPQNLSMPSASKSFVINAGSRSREEQIFRFNDGHPMFAAYPGGKGSVYLSAVPLDRKFSDLPVQGGLFVPLMYKIAISGKRELPLYLTIGEDEWIPLRLPGIAADERISAKSAETEFIPQVRNTGNATEINMSRYADRSGIYTIQSGDAEERIALNYDRSESDLSCFTPGDLSAKYNTKNIAVISNPDKNLTDLVAGMQGGTPLWKLCIILALVFLAAEAILLRFLP